MTDTKTRARERLATALKTLDLANAEAVAFKLATGPFTGSPRSPSTCPLAKYLTVVTGRNVGVGATRAFFDDGEGYASDYLPPAAALFRERFDTGEFPGLDNTVPA